EGGVDEVAQPAMVAAVDVDDVADYLLVQRSLGDSEQLRDRQAREDRVLGAQKELAGFAIEHRVAVRVCGKPPVACGKLRHRRAIALTAETRLGVVELRQLELARERHGGELIRSSRRATRPLAR